MAPKKKKVQIKTKVKKKKWVPIIAPKLFNNAPLGETHVTEDGAVEKKRMTLNLMTVLNDMRKQSYAASFAVLKVHDGKAETAVTGLKMTPSAVKRLIRHGRTKVDDSFLTRVKGGQVVRVKPVVVTVNRCSKAAQSAIRLSIRAKLKEMLKATTLEAFIKEVIDHKIQRLLRDIACTHHPTRSADIRAIVLQTGEKVETDETLGPAPKPTPEPAPAEKAEEPKKEVEEKSKAKKKPKPEKKANVKAEKPAEPKKEDGEKAQKKAEEPKVEAAKAEEPKAEKPEKEAAEAKPEAEKKPEEPKAEKVE